MSPNVDKHVHVLVSDSMSGRLFVQLQDGTPEPPFATGLGLPA